MVHDYGGELIRHRQKMLLEKYESIQSDIVGRYLLREALIEMAKRGRSRDPRTAGHPVDTSNLEQLKNKTMPKKEYDALKKIAAIKEKLDKQVGESVARRSPHRPARKKPTYNKPRSRRPQ